MPANTEPVLDQKTESGTCSEFLRFREISYQRVSMCCRLTNARETTTTLNTKSTPRSPERWPFCKTDRFYVAHLHISNPKLTLNPKLT